MLMFNPSTGEMRDSSDIYEGLWYGMYEGWTPYYTTSGRYLGYRCGPCGTGYVGLAENYVDSYEDLGRWQ